MNSCPTNSGLMNSCRRSARRTAFFCTVLLSALSCSDNSFQGRMPDYTDVSDEVPVQVYVGSSEGAVEVKGSGEIKEYSDFAGKSIFVYAFSAADGVRYDKEFSGSGAPDRLLFNRKAGLDGKESLARWADNERINYPSREYSTWPYDFFACFIDSDEAGRLTISSDKVVMDITLDGRNDIMVSKAEPPAGEYFCYVSARRFINPGFKFSRKLVRLRFKAKPGLTPGTSQEVDIHYVRVKSRTSGALTVASRNGRLDLDFRGDYTALPLMKEDGTDYQEEPLYTWDGNGVNDGQFYIAGGASLLVSPEEAYELSVGLSEPSVNGGSPADNVKKIRLAEGSFLEGNSYDVVFEIFGRNNVAIGVTMTPWSDPVALGGITDDQRPE